MRILSYILLIGLFLLSSCRAKQVLIHSTSTDSTVVMEEYVQREIVVPGDSIRVSLPILIQDNKPVPQKVTARSSRASVQLEITSEGTATAQANCDEYLAKINVLERSVNTYRHDIEVYKQAESKLTEKINDIYRGIKRVVFKIAIIIVLIALFKYLKPISLIIKNVFKWQKNSI